MLRHRHVGVLSACLAVAPVANGHGHINAGATGREPGAPLSIANAGSWDAASGFLIHLRLASTLPYGPLYVGGTDVTFTSLPATADNGGPDPRAALLGAHLEMVWVSLAGPAGGALSFWDSDGFFDATEIRFTVPTGMSQGTNSFALSENDGSAGSDPYGHIHGRKFSADRPGLYTAGFRVVDTSENGPAGGPIHAPSEVVYFNFQAGTTLQVLKTPEAGFQFQFGTESGKGYRVEASRTLGADADWVPVADPIPGTGRLEQVPGIPSDGATRFFRLHID